MTRIASLPVDQWDPELRELAQGDRPAHRSADDARRLCERARAGEAVHASSLAPCRRAFTLRRRLLELVRLRIAFHNQCRSCMAVRYESALEDGLTEDLVCSLEKPMEAPDLTDAEKAAIHYADLAASNHLAITDETIENLRKYYTEKEIVELCIYVAYCIGFGRMAATYRIIEELPESFQDTTTQDRRRGRRNTQSDSSSALEDEHREARRLGSGRCNDRARQRRVRTTRREVGLRNALGPGGHCARSVRDLFVAVGEHEDTQSRDRYREHLFARQLCRNRFPNTRSRSSREDDSFLVWACRMDLLWKACWDTSLKNLPRR